jgi:hypothetical protein
MDQRVENIKKLSATLAARDVEALALYEPLPKQEPFYKSTVKKRIVRGSNRAGKTLTAMVEIARAVTNQDPYGKYPKEGRCVMVAKNLLQVGEVFYKKLFQRGAFKIIKDLETGEWRAFRPTQDRGREHEAKPAPPLIPPRFYDKNAIAWRNKRAKIVSKITLKTGWEILFFSGESPPPNGIDVDLVDFDEEITDPAWYPEISFRLVDRQGKFIWNATPQNGTETLLTLSETAAEQANWPVPDVAEFKLSIFDNPHLPKEEIEQSVREWAKDPEQYRIRIEGEFNSSSFLVYPTFSRNLHSCAAKDDDHPDGIDIDARWNHYMVVDPGKGTCAVSFWAVPPIDHPCHEQRFLYDELYIHQCNADIFADRVQAKIGGRYFHAFLIDPSSMKQDTIGGGPSVFAQYTEALQKRNVISHLTGHSFQFGANDLMAGIFKFESWLHVNGQTGRPKFQYLAGRCTNFEQEIKRYRKRQINGYYVDKPVDRDDHLLDTSRYFAMYDPKWTPPAKRPQEHRVWDLFQSWLKRNKERNGEENPTVDFAGTH